MNTHVKVAAATVLAVVWVSKAALAATAIGHVSVTILPAAAVIETTPIELDATGNHLATPGVVTLTGAPNEAITISVSANDPVTGPGPALQLGRFTHNAGRAPMLSSDGTLTIETTVKMGASRPHGAYSGSHSVIVNY